MGMAPLENERVYSYVGHGAPSLIRQALGDQASESEVEQALEFFLEYYASTTWITPPSTPASRNRSTAAAAGKAHGGAHQQAGSHQPVDCPMAWASMIASFQVYGGNSFDFKKPPHGCGSPPQGGPAPAVAARSWLATVP